MTNLVNARIKIGTTEVIVITDSLGPFPFPARRVFPTVSDAEWETMRLRYPAMFSAPEVLMAHVSCCLILSRGRTVLVDTGVGLSEAPQSGLRGELVRQMHMEGIRPADVDVVVLTHLDADHVGCNVRRDGETAAPTFFNAQYVANRIDWEICKNLPESSASTRFKLDQVLPLYEWDILTLTTGELKIGDGISLIPSPGHTPGHMSVWIESDGEAILLAGDAFYQPLQIPGPHHAFPLDMDRESAESTRLRLIDLVLLRGAYMWACHFPRPGIGRLVSSGHAHYWEPI